MKSQAESQISMMAQPPYPWLSVAWSQFTRQVDEGRLPHAMLLVGADGIGCDHLAQAMAHYLLCVKPVNGQSCGQCKSCQLLKTDVHPDLYTIGLEMNEKTRKLAQNIRIDQVRAVSERTANTAQQGGRKVVVIYPAESMNVASANALLKNLEEPNGDCVFILVSEQSAFLMATIRSRCSKVVLPLPTRDESLQWLERNQIQQAAERLEAVGGRPLKVIEWLESDLWGQKDALRQQLQSLLGNQKDFLACAKAIGGFGALWVIEQLQLWVNQAVKARTLKVQRPQVDILKELLTCEDGKLHSFNDILLEKKALVLSSANPNPQLLLEELLMQLQDLASV